MIKIFLLISLIIFCFALWLFYYYRLYYKMVPLEKIRYDFMEIRLEAEPNIVKIIVDKVKDFFCFLRNKYIALFRYFYAPLDFPSMGMGGGPSPIQCLQLIGSIILPARVYVSDSCVINLKFYPELSQEEPLYLKDQGNPIFSLEKADNNETVIRVSWQNDHRTLTAKLIGVGVDIYPVTCELQEKPNFDFTWGCAFPNSGLQTIILYLCIDSPHSPYGDSAKLIHKVKVVQFDHMTNRQVKVFAGVLVLVSTLLGIAVAIQTLNLSFLFAH